MPHTRLVTQGSAAVRSYGGMHLGECEGTCLFLGCLCVQIRQSRFGGSLKNFFPANGRKSIFSFNSSSMDQCQVALGHFQAEAVLVSLSFLVG